MNNIASKSSIETLEYLLDANLSPAFARRRAHPNRRAWLWVSISCIASFVVATSATSWAGLCADTRDSSARTSAESNNHSEPGQQAQFLSEESCRICIHYKQECAMVDRRQACVSVCDQFKTIKCPSSLPPQEKNRGVGGVRG